MIIDSIQKQIDELEEDLSKKIKIFVEKNKKITYDQIEMYHILDKEQEKKLNETYDKVNALKEQRKAILTDVIVCERDSIKQDKEINYMFDLYQTEINKLISDYEKVKEDICHQKKIYDKKVNDEENEILKYSDELYDEYHTKLDELEKLKEIELKKKQFEEIFKQKKYKNVISPKVQQYDPITLKYIKTYDSISDTLRIFREELNVPNFSDNTLKAAAKGNYEYAGYRWNIIDKNIEDKPYELKPTEKINRAKRNQLIACLNLDKNQIIKVYPSQKDAATDMKLSAIVSISDAIKNESLSRGHYWKFYDDCNNELKEDFIKKGGILPETKPTISGSKAIKQIHPFTKEVLEIFPTIKEIQLKFKMSRDSLKKAIENKTPHNGFYWDYA